MTRRALLKSAMAAVFLGPAACAHGGDIDLVAKRQSFAAYVDEQRVSARIPALSVGVANRAGVVTIAQNGLRCVGCIEQVAADDVFHTGSITKSMTATMIARLVERGLLRWDTTPADLWPAWRSEMDANIAGVTLESILRHRAGFPPMEEDEEISVTPPFDGDARAQRAQFARWLTRRPPMSPVGEHVYSNAGYGFAAAMAEQAADRNWENLMRQELFAPLHMRSAGIGWPAAGQPQGHYYRDGAFVRHELSDGYKLPAFIAPAGDAFASTADMLRYGRAHLRGPEGGDSLLRPETWRKLHDAPIDDYALGWNVRPFGIHHLGSAGTFTASLIIAPLRDIVVHTTMNSADFPGETAMISAVASRTFRDFARPS